MRSSPENTLARGPWGGVVPLGGEPTVNTTGDGLLAPPARAPGCRFPPRPAEGAARTGGKAQNLGVLARPHPREAARPPTDLHRLLLQAVRAPRVRGLGPKRSLKEQISEAASTEGPVGRGALRRRPRPWPTTPSRHSLTHGTPGTQGFLWAGRVLPTLDTASGLHEQTRQVSSARLPEGGGADGGPTHRRVHSQLLPARGRASPVGTVPSHAPAKGALVLGGPQAGAQLRPLERSCFGEVRQRPVPRRGHDHTLPGQEGQQVLGAGGLGEVEGRHGLGGAGGELRWTAARAQTVRRGHGPTPPSPGVHSTGARSRLLQESNMRPTHAQHPGTHVPSETPRVTMGPALLLQQERYGD